MNSDLSIEDFPDDKLLNVSIEQIFPNPKQPRKFFSEKSLNELAQSIKIKGILQPLIVRNHPFKNNCYELVAGERRWRALQKLEVFQVPVVLRKINDDELLEISLLENIQREDLTVIEEAQSYQDLLKFHGYTQEELARRIGKDRSTIANLIRLLQLPSELKNDLERGRISVGHARSILALPSIDSQLEMRQSILKSSLTVRETERQVRQKLSFYSKLLSENNRGKAKIANSNEQNSIKNIHLQNLEEKLQHKLGSRIQIKFLDGRGHIRIDYYSLEEFERIYDVLFSS
tara:strand:+ start:4274 stop:5140 length:867 start_codon:yes stop_codon:yes gene_type:complete